jgi:hypothetical protein
LSQKQVAPHIRRATAGNKLSLKMAFHWVFSRATSSNSQPAIHSVVSAGWELTINLLTPNDL